MDCLLCGHLLGVTLWEQSNRGRKLLFCLGIPRWHHRPNPMRDLAALHTRDIIPWNEKKIHWHWLKHNVGSHGDSRPVTGDASLQSVILDLQYFNYLAPDHQTSLVKSLQITRTKNSSNIATKAEKAQWWCLGLKYILKCLVFTASAVQMQVTIKHIHLAVSAIVHIANTSSTCVYTHG